MTAPDLPLLGRALLYAGLILAGVGLVLLAASKIPWIPGLGRLPGDLIIRRERFVLYVPWVSGLIASVLLSLVFWLMGRFRP